MTFDPLTSAHPPLSTSPERSYYREYGGTVFICHNNHGRSYALRSNNVNPEIWFKGLESFLIRCSRRRFGVDGYFTIQRNAGPAREQYRIEQSAKPMQLSDSHNRILTWHFSSTQKTKKRTITIQLLQWTNDEAQASSRTEIQDHELIQEIQHD